MRHAAIPPSTIDLQDGKALLRGLKVVDAKTYYQTIPYLCPDFGSLLTKPSTTVDI